MAHKRKILIVDDDAETLSLLKGFLRHEKFDVIEAVCAEEALDILESQEVDLVISDLKMSGMNGVDFLEELREWDMEMPVIFISGWGNDDEWLKAMRSSASAFIEKPFRKETILQAVQKAL